MISYILSSDYLSKSVIIYTFVVILEQQSIIQCTNILFFDIEPLLCDALDPVFYKFLDVLRKKLFN